MPDPPDGVQFLVRQVAVPVDPDSVRTATRNDREPTAKIVMRAITVHYRGYGCATGYRLEHLIDLARLRSVGDRVRFLWTGIPVLPLSMTSAENDMITVQCIV